MTDSVDLELTTPDSSSVASLKYHAEAQVLDATFTNGDAWEYFAVSKDEFRDVAFPGPAFDYSVGRAFHQMIRKIKTGRQIRSGKQPAQ